MPHTSEIPDAELGHPIPLKIHQIYLGGPLPEQFHDCVHRLREQNPQWAHTLYADTHARAYIRTHYGVNILRRYDSINQSYGAAKADLLRYLIMYREGGVYLDIKSGLSRPLSELIRTNDRFVLTTWDRTVPGRERFGLDKELASVASGAFQQWNIIAAPRHPFLHAVIRRVIHEIDTYSPWRQGTGGTGTFRVSGPIPYTLAIAPLVSEQLCRITSDTEAGLIYNASSASHKTVFKTHYLRRTDPVVIRTGHYRYTDAIFTILQVVKRKLVNTRET